ncbi:hypothetical protein ACXR5E_003907 [Vibrio mimicus]
MLTKNETEIHDGIEFNEYPAPSFLLKAMHSKWADKLIEQGLIRLNSLSYYQNLDNKELGDALEGKGELRVKSRQYSMSSNNELFVWCCANPESKPEVLLSLDKSYDVVVKVANPIEFIKRISLALEKGGYKFTIPQVGRVNYNRGFEVTLDSLQNRQWQWNAFQKVETYSHQNEYRFVFSKLSCGLEREAPINLCLGDCSDIIERIET